MVAAFDMLRTIRMEEEFIDEIDAGNLVLQENLFGLEIDPRCTQIAYFALALTAWKGVSYHQLPSFNLVCTGRPVKGQLSDWVNLASEDGEIKRIPDTPL